MSFPFTDLDRVGVMVRFAYGHTFFVPEIGKYRSFSDGRWIDENTDAVEMRFYHRTLQFCHEEASRELDGNVLERMQSFIHTAGGAARIRETRGLFRSYPKMQLSVDRFDQHQDILPCSNCTFDLRLGTSYPSYEWDLHSRVMGTRFDVKDDCPTWKNFIRTVTGEDDSLAVFVQMIVGYLLCGGNPLQKMFVVYGPARTGKTTFVQVVQCLFGSLARKTGISTFSDRSPVRNALAALKGTRVVIVDENDSEESGHLNSSLLKQVVGAETVEARYLYREFFEFTVTFKLVIATNYLPAFKVFDEALARRIVPIPFFNRVNPASVDPALSEKLIEELPGILNWALGGWNLVQRHGLHMPFRVQKLLREYTLLYNSADRFIDATCERHYGSRVRSIDLYRLYQAYCKVQGEGRPMKHKSLDTRIADLGFRPTQYRAEFCFENIRIRDRQNIASEWNVLPDDTY
jgi:putative DNA primase/helicase